MRRQSWWDCGAGGLVSFRGILKGAKLRAKDETHAEESVTQMSNSVGANERKSLCLRVMNGTAHRQLSPSTGGEGDETER